MGTSATGVPQVHNSHGGGKEEMWRHSKVPGRKATEAREKEERFKGKWNGGGKHNQGKGCNTYYYRSRGKGLGKGLNNFDADYYDAWGDEMNQCSGDNSNWWGKEWSNGMNVMMMLEGGRERRKTRMLKRMTRSCRQ